MEDLLPGREEDEHESRDKIDVKDVVRDKSKKRKRTSTGGT